MAGNDGGIDAATAIVVAGADGVDPGTENSYASRAQLDQHIEDFTETFDSAPSDEAKDSSLRKATLIVDGMGLSIREWIGSGRTDPKQRLAWPRNDAVFDGHPLPNTLIPDQVVLATLVMAVYILRDPDLVGKIVDHNKVTKRIQAGPVVLERAVGEASSRSDITSTRRRYNMVEDILGSLISEPSVVETNEQRNHNPGAVFSFSAP